MPATHTLPFQVRFYECDAYGLMQPVYYLRRMQEAAFGASAAVGYDFSRYDQLGYLWLVRESEIVYHSPLAYGERVEITTFVEDFRRFRSRRVYQFRSLGRGQLAAEAATDWVYVEAQSLRPAAIPAEMQRAFFPEGPPPESQLRQRFPAPPEPSAAPFQMHQTVAWGEIDMMWHVNNAAYLGYLQEAQMGLFAACGWPLARWQAANLRPQPRQQRLEYRLPAVLGDELDITAWFSQVTPEGLLAHFRLAREGQVLVQAQSSWQGADPLSGAVRPFPEALLEALANFQ